MKILWKLIIYMPSLRKFHSPAVTSREVNEITSPSCNAGYIGKSKRYLSSRFRENGRNGSSYHEHFMRSRAKLHWFSRLWCFDEENLWSLSFLRGLRDISGFHSAPSQRLALFTCLLRRSAMTQWRQKNFGSFENPRLGGPTPFYIRLYGLLF